jgi:hypothetical protein
MWPAGILSKAARRPKRPRAQEPRSPETEAVESPPSPEERPGGQRVEGAGERPAKGQSADCRACGATLLVVDHDVAMSKLRSVAAVAIIKCSCRDGVGFASLAPKAPQNAPERDGVLGVGGGGTCRCRHRRTPTPPLAYSTRAYGVGPPGEKPVWPLQEIPGGTFSLTPAGPGDATSSGAVPHQTGEAQPVAVLEA